MFPYIEQSCFVWGIMSCLLHVTTSDASRINNFIFPLYYVIKGLLHRDEQFSRLWNIQNTVGLKESCLLSKERERVLTVYTRDKFAKVMFSSYLMSKLQPCISPSRKLLTGKNMTPESSCRSFASDVTVRSGTAWRNLPRSIKKKSGNNSIEG